MLGEGLESGGIMIKFIIFNISVSLSVYFAITEKEPAFQSDREHHTAYVSSQTDSDSDIEEIKRLEEYVTAFEKALDYQDELKCRISNSQSDLKESLDSLDKLRIQRQLKHEQHQVILRDYETTQQSISSDRKYGIPPILSARMAIETEKLVNKSSIDIAVFDLSISNLSDKITDLQTIISHARSELRKTSYGK
jgi:hypothetical protein